MPPPDATNPKMPIAFARSAGSVKSFIISDSATAEATAPPRPCTARATIRSPCDVERPHASEAVVNSAMPDEEQPPLAVEVAEPAAEQEEAAEGQQIRVHDPGERGLGEAEIVRIDGSATFTIVESRTIISVPRQRTISAYQRVRLSRRHVVAFLSGRPVRKR